VDVVIDFLEEKNVLPPIKIGSVSLFFKYTY